MDERLKQLLVLGREHYERREYDRAERVLRQVLELTDRYADVFNMLAVICHDRGDFAAMPVEPGEHRVGADEIMELRLGDVAPLAGRTQQVGDDDALPGRRQIADDV